ncbi:MAG: 50S ribosomal protein L3 N(5)-glutamine methyltransferase [Acidiferrobacteraceae bacterium]
MTRPTAAALIDSGARRLRAAGVHFGHGAGSAREEASWLLAHVLRADPRAPLRGTPAAASVARYRALLDQRIRTRRPAAYLLNEAWFAGHKFYVDERVLIPRSLIGEFILERFRPWVRDPRRVRRALDIGTGSGCIAAALARAFPKARIDATDLSRDALTVAARNLRAQRLSARVRLVHSDLFQGLKGRRYDLIVSNPPYVTEHEFRVLPEEYRHEPKQALVAHTRGLALLLALLIDAPRHLTEDGLLVLETGNRARALARLLPQVPLVWLADSAGDGSVALIERAALTASLRAIRRARRALTKPKARRPGKATRVHRRSGARSLRASA